MKRLVKRAVVSASAMILSGLAWAQISDSTLILKVDDPNIRKITKDSGAKASDVNLDFENFLPSQSIALPWRYGQVTFSGLGGNYLPSISDVSKEFVVHGPRSQGIPTATFDSSLRLAFHEPKRWIWLSLIRVSDDVVTYRLLDQSGKEFSTGSLAFPAGTPLGTYRTFFIRFGDPHRVSSIEFGKGVGVLSRIVATAR